MTGLKGLFFLALVFSQTSFTEHSRKADNCFTDHDVHIPVFNNRFSDEEKTGITEEEFLTVLDEAEEVFAPLFEDLEVTFKVNRLWDNSSVNASAQQTGSTWVINMYGGLARHEHATLDSFRAVVCHEIGHHIGGAPKKSSWFSKTSWASNEGQSDYYATYQCMKKLIIEGQAQGLEILSPDLSIYEEEEITLAEEQCSEHFSDELEESEDFRTFTSEEEEDEDSEEPTSEEDDAEEEDTESDDDEDENEDADTDEDGDEETEEPTEIVIDTPYTACKRSVLAGLSLGRLLNSLGSGSEVSLLTPDESEVKKTNHNHPKGQCRADTYLAGALCNLDFNTELSDEDPNIGTCNRKDEFEYGLRPRCWYQPEPKKTGGIFGGIFD